MSPAHRQLVARARQFAQKNQSVPAHRAQHAVSPWFRADLAELCSFAERLARSRSSCTQPAEDWLLDHITFIETQAATVRRQLSPATLGRLPRLKSSGTPRVYALCDDYLCALQGCYDSETFLAYVNAYQDVSPLTLLECAVLPAALRVAVIHRLTGAMREVRQRHRVCEWVARGVERLDPSRPLDQTVPAWLRRLARAHALTPVAVVHLVRHLGERDARLGRIQEWLAAYLDQTTDDLARLIALEHQFQATLEVNAGELLMSLHDIEREPWRDLLPRLSRVDRIFLRNPEQGFWRLAWESRDLLRQRVARVAERLGVAETRVAAAVVDLSRRAREEADDQKPTRSAELAYYLLDPKGVASLRRALGAPPPGLVRTPGAGGSLGLYVGELLVLFAAFMAAFGLAIARGMRLGPFADLALAAGLAFPASQWAVSSLQFAAGRFTQPLALLRYDYAGGLPEHARTMVVMPIIWDAPEEVDDVMDRLLVHFLANREPNIHFAVLADFADAPRATMPEDERILARAQARIEALRAHYGRDRFFLCHRERRYNPADGVYMGWERKRGKLVEFAELLSGSEKTSFMVVDGPKEILPSVRYVMTVDHDTRLPIGVVHRLVATLDHPLNRPRLNPEKTRVVEGYGMLQPRVAVSYDATRRSRFASWMASEPGIDPYAFAASDPYQARFGQTIFVGKGLFDVHVFHQILARRIPDNLVLSHDLLEGGFLATGFASDIEVVEDHPTTFVSFQTRAERWIRGDWQLGRWLRRRCPNRDGVLERVDLVGLTRFQIVENMRRSLMPPALYLVALGGVWVLPGRPLGWEAVVALTLSWPLIQALLARPAGRRGIHRVLAASGQSLFGLATLPYQAVVSAAAIGRALYRLHVSGKNLLEWVPGRLGERRRRDAVVLYPWAGLSAVAAFVAAAELGRVPWPALLWVAGWLLAIPGILWINRPPRRPRRNWSHSAAPKLAAWARDTWAFFDRFVTEGDSWLPPDNVQRDPAPRVAHRTSPTNIGLYLTAVLAACDLDLISPAVMAERLERTLATVSRLPKWRGHLYNWYETESGRPIFPRYVSTVDSGNFVTHLIVLLRGLREWAGRAPDLSDRLLALAEAAERMVEETDFRPLYDPKSRLFRIGYQADEDRLEPNLYDLLASEARQASFIAIALGQAPASHWFTLGRPMTRAAGRPALLSWSGTMFEYLMPSLVMRTVPGGLWHSTYQAVAKRQADYARSRGVPLGISESGYFAFDEDLNYQYRAFGVPGLGLRRNLGKDLVIAPYATFLALPFAGEAAVGALAKLADLGAHGAFGFYEAVDFTARRLPAHRDREVVRSFMAHHQGMALIALANTLREDIMIRRFHADPRVRAASLLLDERLPERPALIRVPAGVRADAPDLEGKREREARGRRFHEPPPVPEVNVLANGAMSSTTRDDGGGFLEWHGLALTRSSQDPVLSDSGVALYLRDAASGVTWSPTPFPTGIPRRVETGFELHKSWYRGRSDDIEWELEVAVDPESDAEVRRLTLQNRSPAGRQLEVTSYVELALAAADVDRAHPAFSKLFVETSLDPERECLLAHRRPRAEDDPEFWAAHAMVVDGSSPVRYEIETARAAFVGRGHDLSAPKALGRRLSGTLGAVTDPIFAVRRTVDLDPAERVTVYLLTTAGRSRAEAMNPIERLRLPSQANRAFHLAWLRSQVDLRLTGLTKNDAFAAQGLASRLLYPAPLSPRRARAIVQNRLGPPALWARGLNGTRPVMVVAVKDWADLPGLVRLARQYQYLRRLHVEADLVVLSEVKEERAVAVDRIRAELQQRGIPLEGVKMVAGADLAPNERKLVRAVARVWLHAGGPSLGAQIAAVPPNRPEVPPAPSARLITPVDDTPASAPEPIGEFFNGWGGFTEDGSAYTLRLLPGRFPPRPWSNVVANPGFGFLITELGTGFTWWKNAHEFKLSPWSNDPVVDRAGEALYLADRESGRVWSATPWPSSQSRAFRVTHGFGHSAFEAANGDLDHRLEVWVPREDPVKVMRLRLTNHGPRPRKIAITYYVEWVLGVDKRNDPFVVTAFDGDRAMLTARNTLADDAFRGTVAFLHLAAPGPTELSWTGDRMEFVGRGRSLANPAGLAQPRLSRRTGVFASSCGAIEATVEVAPGEAAEVVALVGSAGSDAEAASLVEQYRSPERANESLDEVRRFWNDLTSRLEVRTPSRAADVMLNGWLLYQTLGARIWARTGFYQAGGAFGFRDQLQDSLALLPVAPEFCRAQILNAASHQYEEGDVQHWWHSDLGRGIRTRIADDPLWLAYTAARYVEATDDRGLWAVSAPFLKSAPLAEGERERYEAAAAGAPGTILDHCLRAIDRAARLGAHGLPLIGTGDWNDGMNRVGAQGRGESVWLGWFLFEVLTRFLGLGETVLSSPRLNRFRALRVRLEAALNRQAWDGRWFRRAVSDQGTWLGSVESAEGQIDAIAQSWAVISGGAPWHRQRTAMASFDRELVDREYGLTRLLADAYDRAVPSPGYLAAYPAGIRENGGQYTHAAVWSVIAWALLGEGDRAFELFSLLNPVTHTKTPRDVAIYQNEPYVMSGDVSTAPAALARGGWSWYTGSAGWMYQAGVEYLLGIRRRGDRLYLAPSLPAGWERVDFRYRVGRTTYEVTVELTPGQDPRFIWIVDGALTPTPYLLLQDDGRRHEVIARRNAALAAHPR